MVETIITPLTPSENEYGIVATFSDETLNSLVAIQTSLKDILGDAVWLTPRQALHNTLMEIVCDQDYLGISREQLFVNWHTEYNQLVSKAISDLLPCTITYSQLEVSSRAIIVRTDNSDNFNSYRARLLSNISLPLGTKLPPDITHCSLARFSKAVDLDSVIKGIKDIKVAITEQIVGFKLLRDLGPPTFTPKVIEAYDMNTSQS